MIDGGLPCDECGGPTYMHCHVDGIPTTCRDCDYRRAEELQYQEEMRHEEEMRKLEEREIEEHFRRQPHWMPLPSPPTDETAPDGQDMEGK